MAEVYEWRMDNPFLSQQNHWSSSTNLWRSGSWKPNLFIWNSGEKSNTRAHPGEPALEIGQPTSPQDCRGPELLICPNHPCHPDLEHLELSAQVNPAGTLEMQACLAYFIRQSSLSLQASLFWWKVPGFLAAFREELDWKRNLLHWKEEIRVGTPRR